jgi:hypothetical protein
MPPSNTPPTITELPNACDCSTSTTNTDSFTVLRFICNFISYYPDKTTGKYPCIPITDLGMNNYVKDASDTLITYTDLWFVVQDENMPNLSILTLSDTGTLEFWNLLTNGTTTSHQLNMNYLPKGAQRSINNIQVCSTIIPKSGLTFCIMDAQTQPYTVKPQPFTTLITSAYENSTPLNLTTGNFNKLTTLDLSKSTKLTTSAFNSSKFPTSLVTLTLPAALKIDYDFSVLAASVTSITLSEGTTNFSPTKLTDTQFKNVKIPTSLTVMNLPLTSFTATLAGTQITKLSFAGGSLSTFVPGSLPETLTCLDLSLITSC